jgi:DNA-binding transcriptional ArsR family regulator
VGETVLKPKPITTIDDPRLVRALAHPLRVRILALLDERTASPAQLAPQLAASLGVVSYHVRRLETLGMVELVRTGKVRGAVQHFYRAVERPTVSDEAWAKTSPVTKQAILGAAVDQIADYTRRAAAAGAFDRPDAHLTRTMVKLDGRGRKELTRRLHRMLEDIGAIEERVALRRASDGVAEPLEELGLVVMMFDHQPQNLAGARPGPPAG